MWFAMFLRRAREDEEESDEEAMAGWTTGSLWRGSLGDIVGVGGIRNAAKATGQGRLGERLAVTGGTGGAIAGAQQLYCFLAPIIP